MSNLANAFKSMVRNASMTLASFFLVALTLLVVGSVMVISLNTNHLVTNVINSITIQTFVSPDATEEQSTGLAQQIEAINGVAAVTFSSKEDELVDITKTFGENGDTIYEFYEPINPLSDVYSVEVEENVTDFEAIATQIEALDYVDSAEYGEESTTSSFISTMELIQKISFAVSIILACVSLFIITNTIKLNITARYTEIEIMRLVGATKMYIRLPFLVEGLFIGVLGGLLAAVFIHIGYINALEMPTLSIVSPSLVNSTEVSKLVYFSLPLGGMIIGGFGSLFAIRKYLSK